MMFAFVAVLLLAAGSEGVHLEHPREARFFRGAYTSTEVTPQLVTILVPSSCVQVEPSLPPCRHVRNMDGFPRFLTGRVEGGDLSVNTVEKADPKVHSTPLGWGEYLGLYAPTVTVKSLHLETITQPDPLTVVTFSVKGCKPSRLPMDLDLCPSRIPEIKPSPTDNHITATAITDLRPPHLEQPASYGLEPAEFQPESTPRSEPTETLRN